MPDTAAQPAANDQPAEPGESPDRPESRTTPGTALIVVPQPEPKVSLWEALVGFFRGRPDSIRQEITEALSDSQGELAGFSVEERAMLKNILALNEVRVSDVMVSRGEVEAVEMSTTLAELLVLFEETGHSRMPVYCETLDDPRGMVHIRDVLAHLTKAARQKSRSRSAKTTTTPVALDLKKVDLAATIGALKLWRPVLFVPPSMPAAELMKQMQARRIQMALVIDEYGGTDGIVSLEDIVEMVVGDIEDEHDEDERMIIPVGDGVFIVDAKAEIDDVEEAVGPGLKLGEDAEEVDTIGGFVVSSLGRLPVRGEVVKLGDGHECEVTEADARRIRRLKIRPVRSMADTRRRTPRAPKS